MQGALGGAIFSFLDIQGALLWGARDGIFISAARSSGRRIDPGTRSDLLPAYRLLWQGITLIAFGCL